jgi:ribonuclease HII
MMAELHERYPAYDFATHKGYITAAHSAALAEHGPCAIHRRRFINVRRACTSTDDQLEPGLVPVLETEDAR